MLNFHGKCMNIKLKWINVGSVIIWTATRFFLKNFACIQHHNEFKVKQDVTEV